MPCNKYMCMTTLVLVLAQRPIYYYYYYYYYYAMFWPVRALGFGASESPLLNNVQNVMQQSAHEGPKDVRRKLRQALFDPNIQHHHHQICL